MSLHDLPRPHREEQPSVEEAHPSNQSTAMQMIMSWIFSELRRTPVALVAICILSFFTYGLVSDHVSLVQFKDLKDQMSGVQFTLQHDHYDTRMHQTESELFNLNQHVLDEKAKGHDVDQLYSIRIDELTRQDNDLKRSMDILDRSGVPIPLR